MPTPRFFYHAFAIPLSGNIDRPVVHNIDGQATSALVRYGGRSSDSAPPYMLSNILAHQGAASHVSGLYKEDTKTHETAAEATLRGLDLEGVVKVDSLISAVQSSHKADERTHSFSIKGSQITGVSVRGQAVEIESWVDLWNQLDTLQKIRDYYKENADFREKFNAVAFVGRAKELPEKVQRFFPWRNWKQSDKLPEYNNMTIVPLFRIKSDATNQFNVYGNLLQVQNFGRVQLGEMVVEAHQRRVMILHAALGSPCDGNITGGCTGSNGSSGDPPPNP